MDEALGPVAVSLRREKLEDEKEHGQQYNYRLIFRTSEVSRGLPSFLQPKLNILVFYPFVDSRSSFINIKSPFLLEKSYNNFSKCC